MNQFLILDWGGVLIEDPAQDLIRWIAHKYQIDKTELAKALQVLLPLCAQAKITEFELWEQMQYYIPQVKFHPLTWSEALREVFKFRPAILDRIAELKQMGWELVLLSNTEPSAVKFFKEQSWASSFGWIFTSCELKCLKPGPEIYQKVSEQLGSGRYCFFDDKEENLAVPTQMGWECYSVQSETTLMKQLATLG